MAYNSVVFSGSLKDINTAAAAALTVIQPVMAQIDFTVFGSLGIGSIQANLQAQLSAALQATLDIGLGISNPIAGFTAALAGIAVLQASITLALSGNIPVVSPDITAQLSATAAFAATLAVQVGGLEALIQGALAVKGPALSFSGALAAQLNAGPVMVLAFDGVPLGVVGANIAADFAVGLSKSGNTIGPFELASGIVLVTKSPFAWQAMGSMFMTG